MASPRNKVNGWLKCHLCERDASQSYVTIEKNYDGDTTIFLDMCQSCFDENADDHLKDCVYHKSKIECIYCNQPVENDLGEIIMGNKNATGKYCAVMYHVFRYAFMHVECYEENIGI